MTKRDETTTVSPDDELAVMRLKLWIRLLGVTRTVENELREHLRVDHDTTLPRFDVMAALHRYRDGLTMTDLSRTLLISNGNTTAVVNRLVQDGLVERIHSKQDRRRITVALTTKGIGLFEGYAKDHREMVNRLFLALGDGDLIAMRDMLRRVSESLAPGKA
jgi:DNA-binding MarR family transcriptional regulator